MSKSERINQLRRKKAQKIRTQREEYFKSLLDGMKFLRFMGFDEELSKIFAVSEVWSIANNLDTKLDIKVSGDVEGDELDQWLANCASIIPLQDRVFLSCVDFSDLPWSFSQ